MTAGSLIVDFLIVPGPPGAPTPAAAVRALGAMAADKFGAGAAGGLVYHGRTGLCTADYSA